MTLVSLDGEWLIKPYYGMDWRWRDAHMPINRDPRHWVRAMVPGSITHDLWQADEIPNPYFERNSLLLEWIPARTWVYRKAFALDDALRGQRAWLRFEGIDYEAQVFLNGERLGAHVGMYTTAGFEVGELLYYDGENLLAVVIEPAPHEQPQVSRTSLVRTHKSRMTYWWDFCPRMVHVGLWDRVALHFSGAVRLEDVFVRPQLSADLAHAKVSIEATLDAVQPVTVTVESTIRIGEETVGTTLSRAALTAGRNMVAATLQVEQPRLWFPNGYGEQPLYEAEVRVTAGDVVLDRRVVRFGIRHIELKLNETNDGTALPYTFMVNGRRTYIKGWNWVPMDVLYGVERPDKLDWLLTLAARAHVNLLRVWGGGLIEREAFYDRCDELGLMVWQEFILSSSGVENTPSTDPAYIAMMREQAEAIIPRRRNHPSLAVWCGGNELMNANDVPLDDAHPVLAALHDAVARLDPDRPWLPTSPSGPTAINSLVAIERDATALHDVHGPWEYQGVTAHYTLYNAGTSLLHSEFGVEGITNLKTLNATIAPERQRPVSLDNPVWHHLGAWWLKERTWRDVWGDIGDVPALVRATQWIQADGLRYAVEADRRRKYQNSGTLPWQFNEPYPMAACTSAVDYYGRPKPAYYAVARAYEPVHVSARFATVAWAGRETFAADVWANQSSAYSLDEAHWLARVIAVDGRICGQWTGTVALPPDSATRLAAVELPLGEIDSDVFFLDLALTSKSGERLSGNRYCFSQGENLAPLLRVPPTTLVVELAGDALTIRNTGEHAALGVDVEDGRDVDAAGYAHFSDSHFSLLPGEGRTITVTWFGVKPAEQTIGIQGWNTAAVWKPELGFVRSAP